MIPGPLTTGLKMLNLCSGKDEQDFFPSILQILRVTARLVWFRQIKINEKQKNPSEQNVIVEF